MKKKIHFLADKNSGQLRAIPLRLLLLICLSLCVVLPACVKKVVPSLGGVGTPDGPRMNNVHFEVSAQSMLNPSNTLWLKAGEEIIPIWDTYTLVLSYSDPLVNCSFETYTGPTSSCNKCDFCAPDETRCDTLPFPTVPPASTGPWSPNIIKYDVSLVNGEPSLVAEPEYRSGCPSRVHNPFQPEGKNTYQMLAPEISSDNPVPSDYKNRVVLVEKKIFTIGAGLSESALYQLKPHTDTNTAYIWYKFDELVYNTDSMSGIRSIKPVWDENLIYGRREIAVQ